MHACIHDKTKVEINRFSRKNRTGNLYYKKEDSLEKKLTNENKSLNTAD